MGILAKKPTDDAADPAKAAGTGTDKFYEYEVEDQEGSRKELKIKVAADFFKQKIDQAYEKLAPDVKVPGFRPGKAPKNLVETKLGARLYEEAIQLTIPQVTAVVMTEAKLEPLDYAQYKVTKVSQDEGLEYSATFTVIPDVKLPDFKKLKVKPEEAKLDEGEVEDAFKRLVDTTLQGLNKDKKDGEKKVTKKDIDWPKELDDKDLKTEADVKQRLEKVILERKQHQAEDSYVDQLVAEAIDLAKIEAPEQLAEVESKRSEKSYIDRIEQIGLKLEDFLKTQNTDLEELRKGWKKDAEFKISADLLFIAIAKEYEIQVSKEEIEAEINRIQDEETKKSYNNEQGRNYIHSVILRRKSVEKLRELAGDKPKSEK